MKVFNGNLKEILNLLITHFSHFSTKIQEKNGVNMIYYALYYNKVVIYIIQNKFFLFHFHTWLIF